MAKLIITKSEVVIGYTPVYDSYMGQFYPEEIFGTILEHCVVDDNEVARFIDESYFATKQIVCDYYATINGTDFYKYNNDLYFISDEDVYVMNSNFKIMKLV